MASRATASASSRSTGTAPGRLPPVSPARLGVGFSAAVSSPAVSTAVVTVGASPAGAPASTAGGGVTAIEPPDPLPDDELDPEKPPGTVVVTESNGSLSSCGGEMAT